MGIINPYPWLEIPIDQSSSSGSGVELPVAASEGEAIAGVATSLRSWSPLRVGQAGTARAQAWATPNNIGAGYLHGVHSGLTKTNLVWDGTTLTLNSSHVYFYQGTQVAVETGNSVTIERAAGIWYIYYAAADGVLVANQELWDMRETVPIATVYLTAGVDIVNWEGHNSRRDIDWHIHHHTTYGADWLSGLDVVAPVVGNMLINITGGTIRDEDILFDVDTQLNCKLWYPVAENEYVCVNSDRAHLWNGSAVQYIDSATFEPVALIGNQRCNVWVYGTTDITRPLHAFVETMAAPHLTTALARAVPPPARPGIGLSNEYRLLYRFIWGPAEFVEKSDYRADPPLAGGGIGTITASGVVVSPSGLLTATNVQVALESLATAYGTSLPSTYLPGVHFYLTADDDVGKVPAGLYLYIQTGEAAYMWQQVTPGCYDWDGATEIVLPVISEGTHRTVLTDTTSLTLPDDLPVGARVMFSVDYNGNSLTITNTIAWSATIPDLSGLCDFVFKRTATGWNGYVAGFGMAVPA